MYKAWFKRNGLGSTEMAANLHDKEFNRPRFVPSTFMELSAQLSEGAASFLKYRKDPELHDYIEQMWSEEYGALVVY